MEGRKGRGMGKKGGDERGRMKGKEEGEGGDGPLTAIPGSAPGVKSKSNYVRDIEQQKIRPKGSFRYAQYRAQS